MAMAFPKFAPQNARCAKCKQWRRVREMSRVGCPGCVWQTFRCRDCGGLDGAIRSLRAHFGYFKTRRGGDGGHFARAMASIQEWLERRYAA